MNTYRLAIFVFAIGTAFQCIVPQSQAESFKAADRQKELFPIATSYDDVFFACPDTNNPRLSKACRHYRGKFTKTQIACKQEVSQKIALQQSVYANCPQYPIDSHSCFQQLLDNESITALKIEAGIYYISKTLQIRRPNLLIQGLPAVNKLSVSYPIFTNSPPDGNKSASTALLSITPAASKISIASLRFYYAEILGFESDFDIQWGIVTIRGQDLHICDLESVGPRAGTGYTNNFVIQKPAKDIRLEAIKSAYTLDTRPIAYPSGGYVYLLVGTGETDSNGNYLPNGPTNVIFKDVISTKSRGEGFKIDINGAPNLIVDGMRSHHNDRDGIDVAGIINSNAIFMNLLIYNNTAGIVECKNAGVGIPRNITFYNTEGYNNGYGMIFKHCEDIKVVKAYVEGGSVAFQNNPAHRILWKDVVAANFDDSMNVALRAAAGSTNVTVDNMVAYHVARNFQSFAIYVADESNVNFHRLVMIPKQEDPVTYQCIRIANSNSTASLVSFNEPYFYDPGRYDNVCQGSCPGFTQNANSVTAEQQDLLTAWLNGDLNWRNLIDRFDVMLTH